MAHAMIEHVNITVSNPEKTAAMLADLFGWHIRWSGPARDGGRTIHVGSEEHYLAVYAEPDGDGAPASFEKSQPLNHVGIVVDDLDAVEAKAIAHGLTPFNHDDYEPGRRFYFFDRDGIEYEIVSYA
jgi:catechol 2,3-dioxygenase-like lactoylglutathione lyase family enzyme